MPRINQLTTRTPAGNDLLPFDKDIGSGSFQTGKTTLQEVADATIRGAIVNARGLDTFATRAAFVTANTANPGLGLSDGQVIVAGGYEYRRLAASTAIADLLGWVPNAEVTPEHFGAVADGDQAKAVANTTAIQAAIDYLSTTFGGGIVQFPAGVMVANQIILKSGVILQGQGANATELRLGNGANVDFIKSLNFDTLTGSNLWLVSSGMQHGLGLKDLRINGNKANQSAGDGIKFFAKRIYVENVIIHDCFGVGWYSEGGDIPGQAGWQDLPESQIEGLWVRNCGSHGFQFRGPHDAHIEGLVVNENGGDGARFERSAGVYSGACDLQFLHSYANTGRGIFINSAQQGRYQEVIAEYNFGEGIVCEGWWNQFSMVQTYANCRTTGTYNFQITGSHNTVRDYQHKDDGILKSGMLIAGAKNHVNCMMEGAASAGTGLIVGGQWHQIQAHIEDYSGVGGIGLQTGAGSGGQLTNSHIKANITNCATVWNNAVTGSFNNYDINGFAATGQTFFSGSGPNATDANERWNVKGSDQAGNNYLSEIRKTSGGNIDLNTTSEQTITVGCSELLGLTPEPEDVNFNIYYTGSNTAWQLQYIRLQAVSSSLLTFRVKLSTAAGAAETAKIIVRCAL